MYMRKVMEIYRWGRNGHGMIIHQQQHVNISSNQKKIFKSLVEVSHTLFSRLSLSWIQPHTSFWDCCLGVASCSTYNTSSLLLLFPVRRKQLYYLFYQKIFWIYIYMHVDKNFYRLPSEGIMMMMMMECVCVLIFSYWLLLFFISTRNLIHFFPPHFSLCVVSAYSYTQTLLGKGRGKGESIE